MKKRSLVAAIALLVVSAVVLTSSTYAWFASSNSASISGISASTGNTSGSIYISANGTNWYTTLVGDDFNITGNSLPASLTPVSFYNRYVAASGETPAQTPVFFGGSMTQDTNNKMKLTVPSGAADSSKYIKFTVHLYAEAACTVNVTAALTATCGYIYGAFDKGTGAYQIFSKSGNTYRAITHDGSAYDDNAVDGIIDATEAGHSTDGLTIASTDTALGTNVISYTFVDDDPATEGVNESNLGVTHAVSFDVYVWAEGQDSDCFGNVATENVGLALTLAKAS